MSKRLVTLVLLLLIAPAHAEDLTRLSLEAQDSLNVAPDQSPAAQQLLETLSWDAGAFAVRTTAPPADVDCTALVLFDSPAPAGSDDRAVLEWHAACDENGNVIDAPAILLLHILDSRMLLERPMARAMAKAGVHAFILHLPGYGMRSDHQRRPPHVDLAAWQRHAVADARRARDAIAALPHVGNGRVALHGTSLGGFVATFVAALDGAFDPVFIALAGGDIKTLLQNGVNEAAYFRNALAGRGIVGEQLDDLAWQIEPTRVAHRLNPLRTWLFSAVADRVVPAASGLALARSIGLTPDHHVWLIGNHVTSVVNLPWVVGAIVAQVKTEGE